jgi:hypothetical protein
MPCLSRQGDLFVWSPTAGEIRDLRCMPDSRQIGERELEGWTNAPQGRLRHGAYA